MGYLSLYLRDYAAINSILAKNGTILSTRVWTNQSPELILNQILKNKITIGTSYIIRYYPLTLFRISNFSFVKSIRNHIFIHSCHLS